MGLAEGRKDLKGLRPAPVISGTPREKHTWSLSSEDWRGSRSAWRVQGRDQIVQLKACDTHSNLEKEQLFRGKGLMMNPLER